MLTRDELDQLSHEERAKEKVYGWKPWRLRFLRERKNWSQDTLMKQLWSVCGFDTTRTTISNWETGKTRPDVEELPVLAKLLLGSEEAADLFMQAGTEEVREKGKVEGRPGKGAPRKS